MNNIKPRHIVIETMPSIFKELYEQNSTTQQQSKSPEIMGAGISRRPDYIAIRQLTECLARSSEMQRFSEEFQKLAQTLSNAKSLFVRTDELLQINVGKVRHSSIDKEAFKLKNRRNKYGNAKHSSY